MFDFWKAVEGSNEGLKGQQWMRKFRYEALETKLNRNWNEVDFADSWEILVISGNELL